MDNIIRTNALPVIPLRGKVAFPATSVAFEVGREMTVRAVKRASESADRLVLICTQKHTDQDEISAQDVYETGCVAKIKQVAQLAGGVMRVVCEGLYRAKARRIVVEDGCFFAVCDELKAFTDDEIVKEAHFRTAKALVKDVLGADGKLGKETALKLSGIYDADEYIHVAVSAMRVRLEIKQAILEETDCVKRLKLFTRCLNDELEISKIEKKIAATVRQNVDKSQKEYFLREQLKAIHTELGDDGKEEDELREKIKKKGLPEELEAKCLKEIDRMSKMQSSSPEYTVLAGYIEQVLSMPWTEETQDTEDLAECEKVLNEDHFGLEKIKERIVEYLAILKLTGNMKAPILCFVGPPGVGKTSIAKSIARSLGRKFVRMSLGGVKDEAEIRGHRRTYIGAMPGRIMYGMKNAGSINPVFLLDEIDKITSDMHGDPSAALLEALDPEQNSTFRDRYLETPYDLSKVLFLTTANTLDTIPAPLRDRMEIIELSGYTLEEKTQIAKQYLLPKQMKANGLQEGKIVFDDAAYRTVIEGYTREPGVRSLEREIGSICRKVAVKQAKNKRAPRAVITADSVQTYLGTPKFTLDIAALRAQVGAVTGLAWTAVGGKTLTVEVSKMPGKGELKLTGHLGDVMKESAVTALSYLRAHAVEYGLDEQTFKAFDVHVHVPEGATPKDGPSAGITIATAILSALTGREVRGDIAMTGEITLRGRVLPIGGLKEKALAARRVGITTVLIPQGNQKDLEDMPKEVLSDVTFLPVTEVKEVFAYALGESAAVGKRTRKTAVKKSVPTFTDSRQSGGVRCENE